jgi:hypothetical protein
MFQERLMKALVSVFLIAFHKSDLRSIINQLINQLKRFDSGAAEAYEAGKEMAVFRYLFDKSYDSAILVELMDRWLAVCSLELISAAKVKETAKNKAKESQAILTFMQGYFNMTEEEDCPFAMINLIIRGEWNRKVYEIQPFALNAGTKSLLAPKDSRWLPNFHSFVTKRKAPQNSAAIRKNQRRH